jgi:hypothetical protein
VRLYSWKDFCGKYGIWLQRRQRRASTHVHSQINDVLFPTGITCEPSSLLYLCIGDALEMELAKDRREKQR